MRCIRTQTVQYRRPAQTQHKPCSWGPSFTCPFRVSRPQSGRPRTGHGDTQERTIWRALIHGWCSGSGKVNQSWTAPRLMREKFSVSPPSLLGGALGTGTLTGEGGSVQSFPLDTATQQGGCPARLAGLGELGRASGRRGFAHQGHGPIAATSSGSSRRRSCSRPQRYAMGTHLAAPHQRALPAVSRRGPVSRGYPLVPISPPLPESMGCGAGVRYFHVLGSLAWRRRLRGRLPGHQQLRVVP